MRPAAEVGEVALLVDRDRPTVGEIVDELDLVRLAAVLKERQGIGLGEFLRVTAMAALASSAMRSSIFSRSSGVNGRSRSKS